MNEFLRFVVLLRLLVRINISMGNFVRVVIFKKFDLISKQMWTDSLHEDMGYMYDSNGTKHARDDLFWIDII